MSPELPTGTVTYLFTDIEGSTRLVQDLGDQWRAVLERHNQIVREAMVECGGHEVRTEGDAFFVVFPTARGAVRACISAQVSLADDAWPHLARGAIRVRMGLHSGEAVLGGDDYVGLDVHRAARLAAVGHGGQVLLSATTSALARDALPDGFGLRDLGAHRLKDLVHDEQIYQLVGPGLRDAFPPLHSLDSRPNNLPVQLTSFIGRGEDISTVSRMLESARLVTLTGPGGTGKTRLALQVAAEVLPRFPDGVFFVDLAPIADPELVLPATASAIGLTETPDRSLRETVHEWLATRDLLLVVDNFEQVVDAGPLIGRLLASAPGLRMMVTSRTVLGIAGEHEFGVAPLGVPELGDADDPDRVREFEGIALFADRARAVDPEFLLDDESARAVAEITIRLDGLPLALELAAARTRVMSLSALADRLERRMDLLTGGPRDRDARQRTIRGAIDWSHGLLSTRDQILFRRLAVFVGGWDMGAAEAVAAGPDTESALDGLDSLVRQSLIRREATQGGDTRFRMLETIREYARERLVESSEAEELRERHCHHYLALAEKAEPELTSSPLASDRVATEHDNLRAALAWAIEADRAPLGLRLGHALWRFWQLRGHLGEGRDWFDRLLTLPSSESSTRERALGVTGAAGIAYWQNDYNASATWYQEAEAIYRRLEDNRALADALYNVASVAMVQGDTEEAAAKFGEGAALARELGDAAFLVKHLDAEGYLAFMMDDFAQARTVLEEALLTAEADDLQFERAGVHHSLGQISRLEGHDEEAAEQYRLALEIVHRLGAFGPMIEPLQGLAALAVAAGQPLRGARLLGAADAIRERVGGGPPPEWMRLGDPLGDARAAAGDETVDLALSEGRAMDDDEIARAALEDH